MSRKNWSNFFIFMAALNVAVGMLPTNPIKLANWIAIPCCLALGSLARRRMIPKTRSLPPAPPANEIGSL